MEGLTLPENLAVYKKHQRRGGLKWETHPRRKEKEAADLFKSGRLVEGIRVMEDLIDYCSEMGGFDDLASRRVMMQHI